MKAVEGPPAALTIEDLTITVGDGQVLIEQASLRVGPGEFVLLVGPSGSGKSTLLRAIAGLHEPDNDDVRVTGRIAVDGRDGSPDVPRRNVGLVFQDHALFDELPAVDNVQFAIDHRTTPRPIQRDEAQQLLDRLGVPRRKNLSALSGGERQRVAVARALAMDTPMLLFDEPTTGLDPHRTRAVVDLIHETHARSGKTVIVVTHDFAPFLRHSPRLIQIDSEARSLGEVTAAELQLSLERPIEPFPSGSVPTIPNRDRKGARKPNRDRKGANEPSRDGRCEKGISHQRPSRPTPEPRARQSRLAAARADSPRLRRLIPWLESPGRALLTLFASVTAPFCGWRQPRWRLRYLWHYLRMVAVGTTALYVAIAGAMLGFVTVLFAFSQFPYANVTTPLLTEEFLAATGYSAYRVLVPLLIAILMAGKCGASIAADVGVRRLTDQYDAFRNLGVDPSSYLYGNIVIALLVAGPLLTVIAYLSNCYASLIAFLMTSDEATVAVFVRNYFATVWPTTYSLPKATGWVMLKAATSGVLIAALAYAIASRPKASSVEVGRDVGLTIFWASLGVLMLHCAYSFVEF